MSNENNRTESTQQSNKTAEVIFQVKANTRFPHAFKMELPDLKVTGNQKN